MHSIVRDWNQSRLTLGHSFSIHYFIQWTCVCVVKAPSKYAERNQAPILLPFWTLESIPAHHILIVKDYNSKQIDECSLKKQAPVWLWLIFTSAKNIYINIFILIEE